MDTFAHSTSAAMSRTFVRSMAIPRRAAEAATREALCGMTSGSGPPTTVGQKWRSWRRAAEWKVRACALGTPS